MSKQFNGVDVILSRKSAWDAIEAAGVKVWRSRDGKTIAAYDPNKEGARVRLEMGTDGATKVLGEDGVYRYDSSTAYARPFPRKEGQVSGSFFAKISSIVERAVATASKESNAS